MKFATFTGGGYGRSFLFGCDRACGDGNEGGKHACYDSFFHVFSFMHLFFLATRAAWDSKAEDAGGCFKLEGYAGHDVCGKARAFAPYVPGVGLDFKLVAAALFDGR